VTARTPPRPDGELLSVRVQPRAGRNQVVGWHGDALRVRVTAAPQAGEANHAVITLLAEAFAVPRSAVELVRGVAARDKLFRVAGYSLEELRGRLDRGRA
jgi:uncharacterized protein